MYINEINEIVVKYSKMCHGTTTLKHFDILWGKYAEYGW